MILIQNLRVMQNKRLVLSLPRLEIPDQGLSLICGDNGSGKTSLVRTILDIHRDYSGEITINGISNHDLDRRKMAGLISYLPQQEEAVTDFSVRELIEQGLYAAAATYRYVVIEELGIEALLDRKYASLSGGERQLARLARVLIPGTAYVFLDEPDSFLSARNRKKMMSCLENQARYRSLVIISHFGVDYPPGFVHLLDLEET